MAEPASAYSFFNSRLLLHCIPGLAIDVACENSFTTSPLRLSMLMIAGLRPKISSSLRMDS